MSVYRQKYEDWFNQLTDVERKAETARMNSSKSVKRQPAAAKNANNASTTTTINEPKFVNVPSNVTPAGPAFSIANLTPVVMQSGQQIQMQPQQPLPVQQKDRQTLLDDILKREPVEPARSAKQLFVNEFLGKYQMSQQVIIFWKLLKMSHLNFSILAFSTNFCPFKRYLSGFTVLLQVSGFQKLAKIDHFLAFLINYCPLKM